MIALRRNAPFQILYAGAQGKETTVPREYQDVGGVRVHDDFLRRKLPPLAFSTPGRTRGGNHPPGILLFTALETRAAVESTGHPALTCASGSFDPSRGWQM